ncbi:cysteine proteinase inhibitor 5-like [Rutidosis leptorrhynchoides]|uniref:cysteine proteinase inhibitor 5-like n=1 Tax=Rutidosis leptorrhynchoides TaxID=125765 RepID=UPI003A98E9F1
MKHHPCKMHNFLTTILTFFLICISFDSSTALTGGWSPIGDVNNPKIVEIGKFAVDEHNKVDHKSLVFKKVVNGESQVVAGMNYNLTISALDGDAKNDYVALVWDKPWEKFRQLTSFKGPI